MPIPSVEPRPLPSRLLRSAVPDDAQLASYLAASARIASFSLVSSCAMLFGICSHLPQGKLFQPPPILSSDRQPLARLVGQAVDRHVVDDPIARLDQAEETKQAQAHGND